MKKFLTFVLVLAMVLSVSSFAMATGISCSDPCPDATHVAAVVSGGTLSGNNVTGGTTLHYTSLQEAVTDAEGNADSYVVLLTTDAQNCVVTVTGSVNINWGGNSYANSRALSLSGVTFTGSGSAASITFSGYGSANPITDVTLKNITIKDETVGDDEGSWEHGYLEFNNLTAEGVTFCDIQLNGTCSLKKCTFKNTKSSWYAAWVNSGSATFEECDFTGTRGLKVHEADGSDVGNVVVDGCTFDGLTEKPGIAIGTLDSQTTVKIKDSNIMNCQPGDDGEYIYESDTDITTFTFKLEDNTVMVSEELTVSPLELDFETAEAGYSGITPKTVTITNGDNSRPVKVDLPTSSDYELSAVTGDLDANGYIEANGTATFTVKPKDGLGAGNHDENLLLSLTVSPDASPAVNVVRVEAKFNVTAPTTKPSTGSGISVKYNGGNSFSTSNPSVPTGVEIDGVPVTFNGTGSNFSVGCISSDAKWVTVRWNSTSVTTNFTPDGLVECTTVSIPKTGDMSIWAAIAQFLGF